MVRSEQELPQAMYQGRIWPMSQIQVVRVVATCSENVKAHESLQSTCSRAASGWRCLEQVACVAFLQCQSIRVESCDLGTGEAGSYGKSGENKVAINGTCYYQVRTELIA